MNFIGACPTQPEQASNLPIISLTTIALLAFLAILFRQPMLTAIKSDDLTPWAWPTEPEQ